MCIRDSHVTADPVFNLPPASRERGMELLQAARLPQGSRFAVVSVRDWPGTEEFPQKLAGLCDHLRRTYGMEILFLLMQPKHCLLYTSKWNRPHYSRNDL